jgi:DNA-binding NarL/FixJ family response regulator
MQQSPHSDPVGPAILVIDALELRRAGVVSLLKSWADSSGTTIVAIAPPATLSDLPPFKMIVLVIGALRVGDREPQAWISSLLSAHADVPLVLVSDREEAKEVLAAFAAGVSAFIPTSITPTLAMQAFTFVMSGGTFFPPAALMHAIGAKRNPEHASSNRPTILAGTSVPCSGLTVRQQEVLEHLRQGASNKLIGRQLKMRESTVKVHIRQIMRKLGAANRTQAALCAVYLDAPAVLQSAEPNDEKPEEKKPSLVERVHDAPGIAVTAPPEAVAGGGAEVVSAANTTATPFSGETRE